MAPTQGIFMLTHPRSASNMFQVMLSQQQNVYSTGYCFLESALAAWAQIHKGPLSSCSEGDRKAIFDLYDASYDKACKEISETESRGQRIMLKEHAVFIMGPDTILQHYYPEDKIDRPFVVGSKRGDESAEKRNPTCWPDSALLSLQPIFQIRSPLLMFPSMVRAGFASPFSLYSIANDPCLSLRWSRMLYEWYEAQGESVKPLVIDADDIMYNHDAVRQLCTEVGLDPTALKLEWDATSDTNPYMTAFKKTLNASTGILPGLSSTGLTLEVEGPKWIEEFGESDGLKLVELTRFAIPDYEFLRSRRVTGN